MKASSHLSMSPAILALAILAACGNTAARPSASDATRGVPSMPATEAGSTGRAAVGRTGAASGEHSLPAASSARVRSVANAGSASSRNASSEGAGRNFVDHAPEVIRGIYVNAYAAGSRKRLHELLAIADSTELNTFVVDVKDERGPHYDSRIPLARDLTQRGENTLRDLKTFVDTLHAHRIYAVARIVVFKDPLLSKARPEWSIRRPDNGLWTDKKGNTWVSAWNHDVWNYNVEIAEEAARAGFDEVQFDYVRFPEPFRSLPPQVHPEAKGDRTDAIVGFLEEARQRLHPLGVPVAADVFGLSPADGDDIAIGQQWERMLTAADHVLPMLYPSHFLPSHLPSDPRPNRAPGETVYKALGLGSIRIERLKQAGVKHVARVIPWLQAFSAPWVDRDFAYGPEQAREQIEAVYRAGQEDWIFWHPGAKYEAIAAAFAPECERHAQEFQPTAELIGYEKVLERRGARAARELLTRTASGAAPRVTRTLPDRGVEPPR